MIYPNELLPRPAWKYIDCDISNYYLIRRTNSTDQSTYWDKETESLKTDAVCSPREQIQDLSCNLLGIYQYQHILLQITEAGRGKDFENYCDPHFNATAPVYEEDFLLNQNRGFWMIAIAKIQNMEVTYTRNNNLDDIFTAVGYVKHTPTKSNFWHFSLRWRVGDNEVEDLESKEKAKVSRAISNTARVTVAHFAQKEKPPLINIPDECYIA
ncbi:MAG: hypothetical protein H7329_05830 [Opitutaceae bacterium]|nr:hypothetical protein [Cytophagales bacterium]